MLMIDWDDPKMYQSDPEALDNAERPIIIAGNGEVLANHGHVPRT